MIDEFVVVIGVVGFDMVLLFEVFEIDVWKEMFLCVDFKVVFEFID